MNRRAARVDANQRQVVAALRGVGIAVRSTATIGDGFPDLLAAYRGVNVLLEVKDGAKPEGARKLTRAEADFIATWPGPVFVVTSAEEAISFVAETAECHEAAIANAKARAVAGGVWRAVVGLIDSGTPVEALRVMAERNADALERT